MIQLPWSDIIAIPLYKTLYGGIGVAAAETFDPSVLPLLEKAHLIKGFPANLMTPALREALEADAIEYSATSGTSGERMQILRRRGWWPQEYARMFQHHSRLKDFRVGSDRKAILTTAACSSEVCYLEQSGYEQRIVGDTLYLNNDPDPTRWGRAEVQRMALELDRWKPRYMDADPIYLALFLAKLRQFDVPLPEHTPEVVTLCFEFSTAAALRFIKRHLHTSVCLLYGSTEAGYVYVEDDFGIQRCNQMSSVEYLTVDSARDLYSIVLTSFKNEFMPLIRYRTGDIVRLKLAGEPVSEATEVVQFCGREKDAWRRPDGTQITVGDLDNAIAPCSDNLLVYQLVANADRAVFRFVTCNGGPEIQGADIVERLRNLLGLTSVTTRHEQAILPEASGKFCALKKTL